MYSKELGRVGQKMSLDSRATSSASKPIAAIHNRAAGCLNTIPDIDGTRNGGFASASSILSTVWIGLLIEYNGSTYPS